MQLRVTLNIEIKIDIKHAHYSMNVLYGFVFIRVWIREITKKSSFDNMALSQFRKPFIRSIVQKFSALTFDNLFYFLLDPCLKDLDPIKSNLGIRI